MRIIRFLAGATIAAFVPAMAQAAGTTFTGSVKLNLTVVLSTPLTNSQTVFCNLDLRGSDSGAESFAAHGVVKATLKSSTSYACSFSVPYEWTDELDGSATLDITGTYTGAVIDSGLPASSSQIAADSTGTFPVASNVTSGGNLTYTTTVKIE